MQEFILESYLSETLDGQGKHCNVEKINNLRYPDDVVLLVKSPKVIKPHCENKQEIWNESYHENKDHNCQQDRMYKRFIDIERNPIEHLQSSIYLKTGIIVVFGGLKTDQQFTKSE